MSKITKGLKVKLEKLKKIERGKKSRKNKRTKTKKNKSQRGGNEEKDKDYIIGLFIKAQKHLDYIFNNIKRLNGVYSDLVKFSIEFGILHPRDISAKTLKCIDVNNYFNKEYKICDSSEEYSRHFYCDIYEINDILYEVERMFENSKLRGPKMEIYRDELIDEFQHLRININNLFEYFNNNITDNDCELIYHEDVLTLLNAAKTSLTSPIRKLSELFD